MERDIKEIISQMTLEEKAGMCSGLDFWHTKGIERLGIPSIMLTDGPHGLRKQAGQSDHIGLNKSVPATCFPSGATLACSWDRNLISEVGAALGEECQAEEVAILLGPATNIKRSPLCGRNFEYFSEDPYLSSEMAQNHIKGVLEGYLGGQAAGGAIADLLFGAFSPCGKLAETFPLKLSDNPSYLNFPGEVDTVEYKEGLFVGYRYYDKKQLVTLFPFGHGLSYTSFEYSNIIVNKKEMTDDETLEIKVTIKNTGKVTGKEIVQLYVKDVESTVLRPQKELKAFEKIELKPGEEKIITFILEKRAFAYYNVEIKDWHVESGNFEILVGASTKDIKLKETVFVNSTVVIKKKFSRNSTLGDIMLDPKGAKIAESLMKGILGEGNAQGDALGADMTAMLKDLVLRSMVAFSGNKFTEEMMESLVEKLNKLN